MSLDTIAPIIGIGMIFAAIICVSIVAFEIISDVCDLK